MVIARLLADPQHVYDSCDAINADLSNAGFGRSLRVNVDGPFQQLTAEGDSIAVFRRIVEPYFLSADRLFAEQAVVLPAVFVSDMDSTMIAAECIDELADFVGLKPEIAAITERAMAGELDFAGALTERVRLLAGLEEGAIAECLAQRIRLMSGAKTLVGTLKAHGCATVLVTGGFHHFADPIAAELGFERVVANRLAIEAGRLSGALVGDMVDGEVKAAVLRGQEAVHGGPSLATGDGANDVPMLKAATYGIAYRAKPKAKSAADGWIDQGDLTAVLHLLGIPRANWIGQDLP